MLRKVLISVLFVVLVLAFAVGCSSKGSKNDTVTEVPVAETKSADFVYIYFCQFINMTIYF